MASANGNGKNKGTGQDPEAAWKAAQADIPRHDTEFEQQHPNWEQEHGGQR